jgi:predicted RNA-binding protein YlxR (DUF448 family)
LSKRTVLEPKPIRRCLGCKKRDSKEVLLRMVITSAEELVVAADGGVAGRGIYIHLREDCIEHLKRPQVWQWGLRGSGRLTQELATSYCQEVKRYLNETRRLEVGA